MNKYTFSIIILVLILAACQNQNSHFATSANAEKARVIANPATLETGSPNLNESKESLQCSSFVKGTPLGISCLQCSHQNAQNQAIQIAEILRDSCRENIALSVLLDGTFGSDRDFIGELVKISTEKGARLHLYIYLGNGPWQRRTSGIPNRGFGTGIKPEDFRSQIFHNPDLVNKFKSIIKEAEPLISYANTQGAIVYVMPMLEDNLTYSSAREMELIVRNTILPELTYSLGRNPCPSCYPKNDSSVPNGLFRDQHVHSTTANIEAESGLISNDGKSFSFPWENNLDTLSFEELKALIHKSKQKNNAFLIWRKNYQGLVKDTSLNDPDLRSYEEISLEQRNILLELLRTP